MMMVAIISPSPFYTRVWVVKSTGTLVKNQPIKHLLYPKTNVYTTVYTDEHFVAYFHDDTLERYTGAGLLCQLLQGGPRAIDNVYNTLAKCKRVYIQDDGLGDIPFLVAALRKNVPWADGMKPQFTIINDSHKKINFTRV